MSAPDTEQQQHRCNFNPDEPEPAARRHVVCTCGWRSHSTGESAKLESFGHLAGVERREA